jgi:hypothetical protein
LCELYNAKAGGTYMSSCHGACQKLPVTLAQMGQAYAGLCKHYNSTSFLANSLAYFHYFDKIKVGL